MTGISWTSAVWNPTTGCDRISPGCDHCYALTMAKRLKGMGQAKYQADGDPRTSGPGFGLAVHEDALGVPLRRHKPTLWFVNSMSDLGHARIPREFAARIWAVMAATPQHRYQILTKRPDRLSRLLTDECRCGTGHAPGIHLRSEMAWATALANPDRIPGLPGDADRRVYFNADWPLRNAWIGTSIELDRYALRADALRETPAAIRFLSLEPLLGPLPSLSLEGIDWVILGGESGPGHRTLDIAWLEQVVTRCQQLGIPVWTKQDSGPKPGQQGRIPGHLWLHEFPEPATAGAA
jgi:protein gp37